MSVADKKHELYQQVLTFWNWLKTVQEIPTEGDPSDAFTEITSSAGLLYDESQPLLNNLLMAGIDYLQADWKRRKEHDESVQGSH